MKIFRPIIVIIAICLGSASAQVRRDFNRQSTYDVQHYKYELSFDRNKKEVTGDTTVTLTSTEDNLRTIELDSVGIVYSSVTIASISSTHRLVPGKLIITPQTPIKKGQTIDIRMTYTARPKKGIYFVAADRRDGRNVRSAQIWTQGEPDETRHWLPSFDFPSDKATTEGIFTTASTDTVIGNGDLIEKRDNGNGTMTWHYKMPVPHSTYLISFVIGEYHKIEERYRDIPLGIYIYPGREVNARNAYAKTADMMAVFERLTGHNYPFNKYDQTYVAEFQFGGMENITATTMSDNEIFFADFDFGRPLIEDLVAHELAHSWFGNLVTCKNWAELWLNEGFATFMEAVYRERTNGRGDYMRKIRTDAAEFLVRDVSNRARHGLFNQRAGDVGSLFKDASTTYNKGSAVLHTLREEIGDANFWKGVNIYLDRHKFANVETADLKKAMEDASDQKLDWFFEQWVYGGGSPRLDVRPMYNAKNGTLNLTITQTQPADGLTPPIFRLPLDIVVETANSDQKRSIVIDRRQTTTSIKVAARPTAIALDPDEKIPLKRVTVRPVATSRITKR